MEAVLLKSGEALDHLDFQVGKTLDILNFKVREAVDELPLAAIVGKTFHRFNLKIGEARHDLDFEIGKAVDDLHVAKKRKAVISAVFLVEALFRAGSVGEGGGEQNKG